MDAAVRRSTISRRSLLKAGGAAVGTVAVRSITGSSGPASQLTAGGYPARSRERRQVPTVGDTGNSTALPKGDEEMTATALTTTRVLEVQDLIGMGFSKQQVEMLQQLPSNYSAFSEQFDSDREFRQVCFLKWH